MHCLPYTAVLYTAMQALAMQAPAMQAPAMQSTAMPSMVSHSAMMARPNQLGLMSAPLNIQGTQLQGAYMPNPNWQYPTREQTVFLNVKSPQRQLPRDPSLPKGTTRTSTVTRPTLASPINVEDRPVQAQDLPNFKTNMTSLIQDMSQSSLSSFASQFKANSGSKGDSSQDQAQEIS